MSSSAEAFAVPPRRMSRMWKIVAVAVFGLAAVPATLMVGAWAAGHIGDGTPATPAKVTVPTTIR